MIRKNTQSSQRRIAAAVADDWQMQSLCLGHSKGQCNGWGIVLRCDKVDIVGTFYLQFQKNIGQSLYRNPLAALAGIIYTLFSRKYTESTKLTETVKTAKE